MPHWEGIFNDTTYENSCMRNYITENGYGHPFAYFHAGYEGYGWNGIGSAMRFLNVNIPQGAQITTAYFTGIAAQPDANVVVKTRIRGQLSPNSSKFLDGIPGRDDFDMRIWTDAYVNWDNIPSWEEAYWNESVITSPDIKSCIQQIINLIGWVRGNAIVILWDDWQQRSTPSYQTYRRLYPSTLVIEWAMTSSPRQTKLIEDKISLELIRNIEMSARGRFFIDEEGNATYKSRHARNA